VRPRASRRDSRSVLGKGRGLVRRSVAIARLLSPAKLYRAYGHSRSRRRGEAMLADFMASAEPRFKGPVLVDGMWDNPNYWIRYALFRAAVGSAGGREVGVVGTHRAAEGRRTLERFGISRAVQILDLRSDMEAHRREARRLLAETATPADVLNWKLPAGIPADFVYDGILKRQRAASVDLSDRRLLGYVTEALASIAAATRLLDSERFELLLLSHAVNFQFAALAWIAVQRAIPVVLLYGNYGVPRFVKLRGPGDLYDTTDRPTGAELDAIPEARKAALAAVGSAYLEKRLAGRTDDMGARYAFQKAGASVSRAALVEKFGWDPDRPIVGVYASNWFDFPHPCGMSHFRDFLDWTQATLAAAQAQKRVNWLLKAHPCDQWYGGVTLSDLLPPLDAGGHVRLAPTDWNGAAVLDAMDAVITYHGTVGIEAAASGKPVLVADRGWYHDAGFVTWPRSREEYLNALAGDWWKAVDLHATRRRAQVFAGWYFGRPAWQRGFVLADDSVQASIYAQIQRLFAENPEAFRCELDTIRAWFASDQRYYHTFKMSLADEISW
jgi:Capsule polysaccharide biosynthesis protein